MLHGVHGLMDGRYGMNGRMSGDMDCKVRIDEHDDSPKYLHESREMRSFCEVQERLEAHPL